MDAQNEIGHPPRVNHNAVDPPDSVKQQGAKHPAGGALTDVCIRIKKLRGQLYSRLKTK